MTFEFIAELPAEYDARTRYLRCFDGAIVCVHPEQPPLMVELDGTIHAVVHTIRTHVGTSAIFD